jgi:hypothetical protein
MLALLEGGAAAAFRLEAAASAQLGVGETIRLALDGTEAVLVATPRLERGIYRIQTLDLDPGVDTVLELSGSGGQVLGADDDGGDEALASALTFTARSEEAYVASVRGFSDDMVGGFSLRLERVGDLVSETSIASGESLRLSFPATGLVELRMPDLPSGEYRLSTHDLDAEVDTVLELFTDDGVILGADDDGGGEALASMLQFRSEGGTFHASIRSFADAAGGEFSVKLDRIGD